MSRRKRQHTPAAVSDSRRYSVTWELQQLTPRWTAAEAARARALVIRHAHDMCDAARLMRALGLIPAGPS